MKITAIGLPVIQGAWQGTVHSLFRHSCNIMAQDRLITLHDFTFGMLPYSYRVETLQSSLFRIGDKVEASDRGLCIGSQWIIYDAQCERVSTAIPTGMILPDSLGTAWEQVQEYRRQDLSQPLLSEIYAILHGEIDQLWKELVDPEGKEIRSHCARCIGLGQGLTPSGDDMLLGGITAAWMYAPSLVLRLRDAIAPLLHQTNDISANYLRVALSGFVSTPVQTAAAAIGSMETKPIRCLLGIGHSSGRDILVGLLYAMEHMSKGRH